MKHYFVEWDEYRNKNHYHKTALVVAETAKLAREKMQRLKYDRQAAGFPYMFHLDVKLYRGQEVDTPTYYRLYGEPKIVSSDYLWVPYTEYDSRTHEVHIHGSEDFSPERLRDQTTVYDVYADGEYCNTVRCRGNIYACMALKYRTGDVSLKRRKE